MTPSAILSSSFRLAWSQLAHGRTKLIVATVGVMFASVLVFMQLGFKDSLYASAASAPKKVEGDLFLLHKQTEAMWRTQQLDRRILMRTLGHPAVHTVSPLYVAQLPWKNPVTKIKRTLMIFGADPYAKILASGEVFPFAEELRKADHVLFDEASRPEFGPIPQLLKEQGSIETEIADRKVKVVGTLRLGTSFAADGNVVTSDTNFLRLLPSRHPTQIDIGVIKLKPESDLLTVQKDLRTLLEEEVMVLTYAELVQHELAYWQNNAPIGFIFGFGTVMGLIVGMVIVYQILFTDITNHLAEYATLKAMGYDQWYLMSVVLASSLYLAVLGFIPGWGVSYFLYQLSAKATFIPMPMMLSKIITVFVLIVVMCFSAGALAMNKMKSANPADMF